MRIYKNLYEATKETQRDLHEMGMIVKLKTYQNIDVTQDESRSTTKEISGHTFRIEDPYQQDGIDTAYRLLHGNQEYIAMLKKWVQEEFFERINPHGMVNPGEAWKIRADIWKDLFSKEIQGKFDYTYNERFFVLDQLNRIINALQEDINSRRCVLQVYQWDKDIEGVEKQRRVPCSVDYSWLYRENQLNIFYHMRSCDFYEHFINDMNLAGKLNWWIASQVGVKAGALIVFINSLHAYKKDLDERKIF